jgi:hypothetical protein
MEGASSQSKKRLLASEEEHHRHFPWRMPSLPNQEARKEKDKKSTD